MTITSRDYGLFTTQINVEIEAGTSIGKKVTVVFESTVETFDDIGGDPILDIEYTPGANGYATATALLTTTAFVGTGTRADAGLDTQRTADIPAPGVLDYVSSNAGDTTQEITVYGLNGVAPVSETVTLNGTGSSDIDGNPLTYHWSFTSIPAGSGATLTNSTTANPTFLADKAGQYVAQLIVNDGLVNSAPAAVTISTANTAPVANAGPNQTAAVGATVILNGSEYGLLANHSLVLAGHAARASVALQALRQFGVGHRHRETLDGIRKFGWRST